MTATMVISFASGQQNTHTHIGLSNLPQHQHIHTCSQTMNTTTLVVTLSGWRMTTKRGQPLRAVAKAGCDEAIEEAQTVGGCAFTVDRQQQPRAPVFRPPHCHVVGLAILVFVGSRSIGGCSAVQDRNEGDGVGWGCRDIGWWLENIVGLWFRIV